MSALTSLPKSPTAIRTPPLSTVRSVATLHRLVRGHSGLPAMDHQSYAKVHHSKGHDWVECGSRHEGSMPGSGQRGAGDGGRTRDLLLGKYLRSSAVLPRSEVRA